MPPKYSKVLSYNSILPLNSFNKGASLSPKATNNLKVLCPAVGVSIGSGCFTLVAFVMVSLKAAYLHRSPLSQHRPFIGSFPVNPHPFLAGPPTTGEEGSLMLAFSDGLALPSCRLTFRLKGALSY
jgi:hypothetical protein